MKTPVNKPPRSKVVKVIKQDQNKRFALKQSLNGKWCFFTVEFTKDKISRQMSKLNTIAEQISLRNSLIDSTSIDNYMLNNPSISTSAYNGRLANCHKNIQPQLKQERK